MRRLCKVAKALSVMEDRAQNDMSSVCRQVKCSKPSSVMDCLHPDIFKVRECDNGTKAASAIVGWLQSDMSKAVRADMPQNALSVMVVCLQRAIFSICNQLR